MRGAACRQGNQEAFLHMSNHYRRIYNAKCAVDASAPHSSRRQQPSRSNLSPCDLAIVDIITSDSKQSPNSYANHAWLEKGQQQEKCRPAYRPLNRNYCKKVINKIPTDLIDRHAENFECSNKAFKPRILKTDAQSRVREMRVYHPPSRRKRSREFRSSQEKWKEEVTSVQLSDLCSAKKAASSKESSRDSAYNGGISSGADTPEQASPVSGICGIEPSDPVRCHPRKTPSAAGSCVADNSPIRQSNQPLRLISCSNTSPIECQRTLPSEQSKCLSEDVAYIQFIHNITEDVLARGIYSDRGLRQLFERHVANNEGRLSMERMREEVAKLCQQLGISEEDTCKGERSKCMHNFGVFMDKIKSIQNSENFRTGNQRTTRSQQEQHVEEQTEVENLATRNKRNAMHNIAVPFVGDLEHSREALFAKIADHIENSHGVRYSVEEERDSDDKRNTGFENVNTGIHDSTKKSSPMCVCKGTETETDKEDFVNVGCQTSEISVTSRYAGSGTILIPEDRLEYMLSEFVEDDSEVITFPYTRRAVAQAAEEMINKLDRYDVLQTVGMKDEIVRAAAEVVTYIMEEAFITYNIITAKDQNMV